MRKHIVMLSALVAAFASFAAPFTDGGVTYTPNDEVTRRQPVVTGVNVTGMVESVAYTKGEVDRRIETNAPVRSVNGMRGNVKLGAREVGALPDNRAYLEDDANFVEAVRNVQIKGGGGGDDKRGIDDNICHKSGFSEWDFGEHAGMGIELRYVGSSSWELWASNRTEFIHVADYRGNEDDLVVFKVSGLSTAPAFYSRKALCESGDLFITAGSMKDKRDIDDLDMYDYAPFVADNPSIRHPFVHVLGPTWISSSDGVILALTYQGNGIWGIGVNATTPYITAAGDEGALSLDFGAFTVTREAVTVKVDRIVTTNGLNAVVESTVKSTVNRVKDLQYDAGLGVTWTNIVDNGHIYYVTVTNTNVSVIP